jgi:hypothetical protein
MLFNVRIFFRLKNPSIRGFVWTEFMSTIVRFQALKAASVKMIVLWNIAMCSMVETDGRFRDAYCLHNRPDDGGI